MVFATNPVSFSACSCMVATLCQQCSHTVLLEVAARQSLFDLVGCSKMNHQFLTGGQYRNEAHHTAGRYGVGLQNHIGHTEHRKARELIHIGMQRRQLSRFLSCNAIGKQPNHQYEPHRTPDLRGQPHPHDRENPNEHHPIKQQVRDAVQLGTKVRDAPRGTSNETVQRIGNTCQRIHQKEGRGQRLHSKQGQRPHNAQTRYEIGQRPIHGVQHSLGDNYSLYYTMFQNQIPCKIPLRNFHTSFPQNPTNILFIIDITALLC